jgi:hypothetical protein
LPLAFPLDSRNLEEKDIFKADFMSIPQRGNEMSVHVDTCENLT